MEFAKELVLKYRVYTIENGLLLEPKEDYYGRKQTVFSDFDTIEQAHAAILERDLIDEYIILPITSVEMRIR